MCSSSILGDSTAKMARVDAVVTGPVAWGMRPTTAARIALGLGNAASDLPRTLLASPVIVSANSPPQVTLIDVSDILYSDDGDADVSVTDQAALRMSSHPTNAIAAGSPAAPIATTVVSFWQTNTIAIRAGRWRPVGLPLGDARPVQSQCVAISGEERRRVMKPTDHFVIDGCLVPRGVIDLVARRRAVGKRREVAGDAP